MKIEIRQIADGYAVAGQLWSENMAEVKAAGFGAVVNNRPDGEEAGQPMAAELEAAARAVGLGYVHIPIAGGIFAGDVAAMAEALDALPGPVLGFCRSGVRSARIFEAVAAR